MNLQCRLLGKPAIVLDVAETSSIKELKAQFAAAAELPEDGFRLVYSGRICSDDKTIEEIGAEDGSTFHVVRCPPPAAAPAPEVVSSAPGASVGAGCASGECGGAAAPSFPGLSGVGGLPGGLPGMNGLPTPEMLQQVFNNPEILKTLSAMAGNKEFVDQIRNNSSFVSAIAQQNPNLVNTVLQSDMMKNMLQPEVLRDLASTLGAAGGAGLSPEAFETSLASMQNELKNTPNLKNFLDSVGQRAEAGASPETRFELELLQLNEMGFLDKEKNLAALQQAKGDVDTAVSLLLENRG